MGLRPGSVRAPEAPGSAAPGFGLLASGFDAPGFDAPGFRQDGRLESGIASGREEGTPAGGPLSPYLDNSTVRLLALLRLVGAERERYR